MKACHVILDAVIYWLLIALCCQFVSSSPLNLQSIHNLIHRHSRQQHHGIVKSCLHPVPAAETDDINYAIDNNNKCDLYSCVSEELSCATIVSSAASRMCSAVNKLSQQLDQQVLEWLERTNDCVIRRLRRQLADLRTSSSRGACANVDFRLRIDLHACAQLNDAEMCSTLLWNKRHSMLKVFAGINWLWLVEIARSCPRDVTTRFVTWAMTSSENDSSR